MITNSPTNTLEFKDFLKLKNDSDFNDFLQSVTIAEPEVKQKNTLKPRILNLKKASDFSSLERIKIVVDGLIGGECEKEICKKEGITFKIYSNWKDEFFTAFNKYSEIKILQKALNSNNKKTIVDEIGTEAYNFFKSFIDISSIKNLVIPQNKRFSTYKNIEGIENVILLDRINNFRQINKQFEKVNAKLPNGGVLLGNFETFKARAKRNPIYKIPVLKHLYFGFEFLFKRVFPKLPILKKLYFLSTKGKNRFLSKAESLGRLVSCGFDIIDVKEIDGINYFVAKKVKEPAFNMSPSYGPLFKMNRVGKNGKIIGVYKLRTMHPYSEYLQDYVLKLNGYAESGKPADDFRIVPWGKFMRRYWFDELPQLLNVLKGELKLVGVRPVSERYFQDIPKDIQELRLTQKPGCVPPYVALDRKGSVSSVLQAEKEYLEEKNKNPYTTDTKYFFKAMYNIIFKKKRSA